MKYLKEFEIINNGQPKRGDYVIVNYNYGDFHNLNNFLNNNIGKILDINNNEIYISYNVLEKDMLESIKTYFITYEDNIYKISLEMEYTDINFSSNKEDLEILLQANKFNL